jgi:hypothetical protein
MPRVTASYRTWPLQHRAVLLYLYHRTILYELPAQGGSLPKMLKISNGICELTVNPTGLYIGPNSLENYALSIAPTCAPGGLKL